MIVLRFGLGSFVLWRYRFSLLKRMPHIPLFASLSIALTALAVIVAAVAFAPTYLAGVDGIEVAATHLRDSINQNIKHTLSEYINLPTRVNALSVSMINKNTVPVTDNLTEFRTWCFEMLRLYPEVNYFVFADDRDGMYMGCLTSVNSTSGDTLYRWRAMVNEDNTKNISAGLNSWFVSPSNVLQNIKWERVL